MRPSALFTVVVMALAVTWSSRAATLAAGPDLGGANEAATGAPATEPVVEAIEPVAKATDTAEPSR